MSMARESPRLRTRRVRKSAFGQTADGSILWIEAPRRVDRMPWAEIMRNISYREEVDLRAAVYLYIRKELSDETIDYSDCF